MNFSVYKPMPCSEERMISEMFVPLSFRCANMNLTSERARLIT